LNIDIKSIVGIVSTLLSLLYMRGIMTQRVHFKVIMKLFKDYYRHKRGWKLWSARKTPMNNGTVNFSALSASGIFITSWLTSKRSSDKRTIVSVVVYLIISDALEKFIV